MKDPTTEVNAVSIPLAAVMREASATPRLEDEVIGLFDQYRAPVLRYLLSRRIEMADAEEIAQEVFLALFRHLRAGRSRSNLPGWIFAVAHNLALKHRAGEKRRSGQVEATAEAVERALSPIASPEAQMGEKQRRGRLMGVVRALPELDQSCLTLRAEGLRYREIARVLGISLGSVANCLARALQRLSRVDEMFR